MKRKPPPAMPDLYADPFGERSAALAGMSVQLLGGRFRFESNSRELMRLVERAYAGLPAHRLPGMNPRFEVRLHLTSPRRSNESVKSRQSPRRGEPPPLAMLHGAGLLGGATSASNFVVMSPHERSALVVLTPQMLRYSYHARYELIEFAVYTLASRVQRLVPLHAACIGHRGRGILLMGASGAGKSTVALHWLLAGLDFLSEDSAFVTADSLLATGVANYLHIRADSLRWLGRSSEAARVRAAPVIRRRSGVEKFEVDLRRHPFHLARSPLRIVAVAFLSPRPAGRQGMLRPLTRSQALANLSRTQAYAAAQTPWREFCSKLRDLDVFELRRGTHPREAVEALRASLAGR